MSLNAGKLNRPSKIINFDDDKDSKNEKQKLKQNSPDY